MPNQDCQAEQLEYFWKYFHANITIFKRATAYKARIHGMMICEYPPGQET